MDDFKDFYTTKIVVELEISTQMGPHSAFNLVQNNLVPIEAVRSLKVLKAESNFNIDEVRAGNRKPTKEFINVPVPAWVNK
jgi:hypothetical protein